MIITLETQKVTCTYTTCLQGLNIEGYCDIVLNSHDHHTTDIHLIVNYLNFSYEFHFCGRFQLSVALVLRRDAIF